MDLSFLRAADTGSCSYGGGLHFMSKAAPRLACLPDSSANYLSDWPFRTSPENLSTALSLSVINPGLIVFGLASAFFGLSLALFAVCTDLVDIDLKLEDTYIRYIVFLDRLCNDSLKMVDAVGDAFLAVPSRVRAEFMDAVVAISTIAFRIPFSTPWIYRYAASMVHHILSVPRLGVQSRALTICAPSSSVKLADHPGRTPLRAAHHWAVDSVGAYFFLTAEWIYARGKSLYAIICAGATRALALAVQLPSGRTYSRAWSGAMRPRGDRPIHHPANTSRLNHGEAVLTWCVHEGESLAPVQNVDGHAEMSFNVTLDLDIDEGGDLRVALVPDVSMQGSAVMLRVLCDAEIQTEDQAPRPEEQEVRTEEEPGVGVAPAGPEGGSARENMDGLALTTRFCTTSSTRSHVPTFRARGFTFKFNPHAPSFAPARPASPPRSTRHATDSRRDTASGTRLNPLAEEFKAQALLPAVDDSLANAPGYRPDLETKGCTLGGPVSPPYSELRRAMLRAYLSPLPLDALTFVSSHEGSGRAMGEDGGHAREAGVRRG